MRFRPEIQTGDLDQIISKAIQIGTLKAWRGRVAACEDQIRSNPFLQPLLAEKFAIEMAMARVQRYKKATGRIPSVDLWSMSEHRLMAFCAALTIVYERVSPKGQRELQGRVRGGLNDDSGLGSLSFELQTISHLMQVGAEVEWNDLEGNGGYDFLVFRNGMEIEVECKTSSGDIGRKIHSVRHYQLGRLIYSDSNSLVKAGKRLFVDILIPDRLNGSEIPSIADCVRSSLLAGKDFEGFHPCTVTIHPFDVRGTLIESELYSSQKDQDKITAYIRDVFKLDRSNFLINAGPSGNCIISLGSRKTDSVVDSLYRQIKTGANQLSGTRPGIICVRLQDVTPAQLIQLKEESKSKPTAFGMMIARLFHNGKNKDVHTISFSTPGVLHKSNEVLHSVSTFNSRETGPSFTIKNETHPLVSDPRLEIFDRPYP